MKNTTLLIMILIAFTNVVNAQKSKLIGSWLMTKAETGGDIYNPYQITDFNDNGKFHLMGFDAGTREYNKANNSIVIKSELDK